MDRKTLLLVTLFVEGGLYLFGLLLMGGPSAFQSRFRLSWSATGYALLLCLPLFLSLYFAMWTKWEPLSRLRKEISEKVVPIFGNCKFIDLGLIAFLAGVGEEVFFRGWLQGSLANRLGIWIGILIASVIFGFAHYLSPTYAIYAFIMGVYLGVIYQVSENLYIIMAIHGVYNFVALVYLVREGRNGETGLPTGDNTERS
jgi:membrane protease YdiL (CAAX protease family)